MLLKANVNPLPKKQQHTQNKNKTKPKNTYKDYMIV